ncbi:MAG: type IV pilus modification protein PilV [Gammaproteobacteria bacterium]
MNIKQSNTQKSRLQQGFTLIEVLVSMVILSIGLLGLAGLQTTGLRNNQSAYFSSQAAIYANDIFERMRANRTAAIDGGEYNIAAGTDANSSGTSIADADLTEWKTLVATLPGPGTGSVANNSGMITVTIQWDDSHVTESNGSINGSSTRTISVESEL